MTLHDPLWMTGLLYSGQEDRQLVTAIGDAGVLGAADLAVTQRAAGATMSVDVAPGRCILPGQIGSYLCYSDAVKSVGPLAAAPGIGTSRIDLVYAQLRDADITGTDKDWVIDKVTGTASGSPVAPSLPSVYCIELARVLVTSATSSIVDGAITNARRQSTGSSVWPIEGNALFGLQGATSTAAAWGTVVIPAPNRPVKVKAWSEGAFACGTTETNIVAEMAVRAEYGATSLTPSGILQISANEFAPVAVPRSERFICDSGVTAGVVVGPTPGVGEAITVSLRIKTGAGTGNFDRGRLMVQVHP